MHILKKGAKISQLQPTLKTNSIIKNISETENGDIFFISARIQFIANKSSHLWYNESISCGETFIISIKISGPPIDRKLSKIGQSVSSS